MKSNISTKQIGDVSVIALRGRIHLGEESNSLRERPNSLIGEGKKIVLTMANVTYIDSAGSTRRDRPANRCSHAVLWP
jgi:anti-anti-sigma regulatory factor